MLAAELNNCIYLSIDPFSPRTRTCALSRLPVGYA